MPFTYRIDEEKKLIELNGYDLITRSEIINILQAVLFDPTRKKGFGFIMNFGQADLSALKAKDLEITIAHQKKFGDEYRFSKVSIVAQNDREFGIARMWEMMGFGDITNVKIFRNLPDAMDWLGVEN